MPTQLSLDHDEIERRKAYYRRVFDYQEVDHLPVFIWLMGFDKSGDYNLRADLESTERQFQVNMGVIERTLRLVPDDYIPTVRITQGYMTIATMFGIEIHWSDDPNQPPGIGSHIIHDLAEVYKLHRPTMEDGLMPENVHRLQYFAQNLPPDVYLTGVDNGGPLNNLKDLLDTNLLYTGFYDDPQAVHYLLNLLTDIQLEMHHTIIKSVGDIRRLGCIDFDPLWHPEKYISFCSDDVCATISLKIFKEFSLPYNNRLYQPWGSGGLHNCGPHPCKRQYLEHHPRVKYLNCSHRYSRDEYAEFKELFAGWGILETMFDNGETAEEMLAAYRSMMECLAPETIAIPYCLVDQTWADDDITCLYCEMRKIAEEYARNMRWAEG